MSLISPNFDVKSIIFFHNFGQGPLPIIARKSPVLVLDDVNVDNKMVIARESSDVAHSIGVQNVVLPFFCLQEPIYNVFVIVFCFETRDVRLPC